MDNENNGTPEVPSGDAETPPPTEQYYPSVQLQRINRLTEQNDTLTLEVERLRTELASALETVRALREEQIDGSDFRLTDFWAKAQGLADDHEYCEIFDQLVEELGGPRRTREYEVVVSGTVTVPWSITVTVEATDEQDAREQAEEKVDDRYSADDLEDHADWYSADLMSIDEIELA